MLEIGTQVIYRKTKHSQDPGPRAAAVTPSRFGDSYGYFVDKFWVVVENQDPETLVVMTRRGKRLTIPADDPNLRAASWFDRIRYWGRFPSIDE